MGMVSETELYRKHLLATGMRSRTKDVVLIGRGSVETFLRLGSSALTISRFVAWRAWLGSRR